MSVSHNGGGPPLPKRTTSQRQPRVTASHAPPQNWRSNSAETPPPLPPHHPESKTFPRRTNKSESDASSRDAPDLSSRTHGSHAHGIQRKTFETNSTPAVPDQHSRHNEQHSKQSIRERPLPPPPSTDTIPSSQRRPSVTNEAPNHERPLPPPPPPNTDRVSSDRRPPVSNQASHHDRSLPPPPSISTIPTGRRQSIPEHVPHHDQPLPPPPPIQFIPTVTLAQDKTHRIPAVFEASDTPPPPPARRPTIHVKFQQVSGDSPPPLPPSRPKNSSASSQSSKHSTTDPFDYEKRFVFHDASEFPEPEDFSNKTKEYPSQVMNKRKTKETGPLGAL